MLAELRELWRFRELLFSLVERELRIRYKNSFFGFLWSLLNPLITVVVITLVFKNFLRNDTPNLSAYILAAYLPFLFFQMAVMDSSQSVLLSLQLVKKIYFPREILPLASILSNLIHLLLALLVFVAYLIVIYIGDPRIPSIQPTILLLPIVILINLTLVVGIGFIVSALNTFYEDVKYIVGVLMYLLFFGCPIFYFSENVWAHSLSRGDGGWSYYLYHLNPVAMLCTAYRKVLVAPQPVKIGDSVYDPLPLDWGLLGIAAALSLALMVFGYWLFIRLKWRFVERP
ncbi:MAG: ABC transporter permease [Armatimonadetes bacterium]|uniref:Transport permease protein n=1 Tax=Candidatus Nitrosymbiomonas proteolyticus TaxID=2608984 RepID=A0A809S4S5_9BACT|nr:MAG: hypothetical protein EDM74_02080 [Armatimonadota bacterium]MBV6491567.1 hypothetical protein [Fimbriimonadaceae bacterium]QOJ11946.1 MAG: ABC transporter permease [Chthonomonadaceae bacterium]BBO23807.1 ABC type polysaccharide/polyol phosphate exporter, permease [Candidatus Nitrosymbiomonas proteolyticus]MBL1152442.1 hypothetical protein [Armatimonadota bacterium]